MFRTLVLVKNTPPNRPDFLLFGELSASEGHLRRGYFAVFTTTGAAFVHLVVGRVEQDESTVNGQFVQSRHLVRFVETSQLLQQGRVCYLRRAYF